MTEIIGKYKIITDDNNFKIRYRYSFSDIIGSLWYLLSFSLGLLLIIVAQNTFKPDSVDSWLMLVFGLFVFGFGTYLLLAGLYNPGKGVFQIDKIESTIIVRDFLKSHIFNLDDFVNLTYDLKSSTRPRTKYAVLSLRLKNNEKIDCFIIRSSIPIDLGKKVDKELHLIARQLRDRISGAIRNIKNSP